MSADIENDLNSSLSSAIRKKEYKHLLDVGGQAAENVEVNSVVDNLITLKGLLTESNKLAAQGVITDRIGQSAEVVLDAQVCKLASDLMGTTVSKIENNEFSDDAFVAGLTESVLDENNVCDWSKWDEHIVCSAKFYCYKPSFYGAFDFDEVATSTQIQKERKVRRKAEVGIEKRPTNVTEAATNQSGHPKVDIVLNTIKDIYKKNGRKPIPYFQLVIDPTNMMYTFDNTFQLSFLFRDGMISFVKDREGLPAIVPLDEATKPPKPSEMTSFTSSLGHDLIEKYIQKYNIRKPVLNIPREN
ncbi:EP300-interacting inhibitor of differentiation 3 [Contarinia nasturtii]|uniref:EP300-interacting inhibitor of differentiation 3 n=1 Tax=Contarinia nasturtii TaxID=265458 RepID=UPI0012D470F1|nr:EP300-interacting inhibitor of differentiation 3 [Contarinia nasturtii]